MSMFEIKKLQALRGNGSKCDKMLDQMKLEALDFVRNFSDSKDHMSEWGHNYFCPKDGERLVFDLSKPNIHQCALCGERYESEQLDRVWIYFYRNEAILTLMKLALLYEVDKESVYLEGYKKILGFYATNYEKFVLHAKDKVIDDLTFDVGGAGRLMPQGLNEAIVLIRIVTSLEIMKDSMDKEFVEKVVEGLLNPAVKILKPQLIRIHNIPCWINAALGVVGLYTGDKALVDFVYNGEFGIKEQLKQGVTKDKFWYEGSIHYNFFLLEGVVNLLMFSHIYNQPLEEQSIVEAMLKQAYEYAFDNDSFPNPNDGWPNVNLKSYDYIYAGMAKILGESSEMGNIYKNILEHPSARGEFPLSKPYHYMNEVSFEHLLYFPSLVSQNCEPIKRTSFCFEDSYFTMLRNDRMNVFLKYGHQGPSHAHPDKMTIEVTWEDKVLTRDLSNSGYASVLCNEWHRTSLAHNTVVVDGQNHVSMEGGTVKAYTDTMCESFVKNVYEGVDFTRTLALKETGYTDDFKVESHSEHTYDWIFHSQAVLKTQYETEASELGFKTNGYQHLKDVRHVLTTKEEVELIWVLDDILLKCTVALNGSEMYIAKTYDNPASTYRTAIILRKKGSVAEYAIKWEGI